ncbi:endo alpha-1,4 polygalactosaminidase [Metabacillus sp. 113a]|uniref:endo alpha-1,4 polygalactosaminidase n=1 Tax=Metabacillus sp. 113a TaxID=3404706 RepID=UPI003CF1488F
MKKKIIVLICTGAVLMLSFWFFSHSGKPVNPLADVTRYKIYYGSPNEKIIKKLAEFPLVIIEPVFYSGKQISEIQKDGTLVYGYINSMEADRWNHDLFKKFTDQDFFKKDGKKVYIKEWDAYLMDMKSTGYRTKLLNEADKQISDKQLDGVFMDTVGDIDDYFADDPKELNAQQEGLILLFQDLENRGLSIIQNWGMNTAAKTAPYIDGFMWESFQYTKIREDQWSLNWIKKMRGLSDEHGFKIFTVSSKEKAKSAKYSADHGFVHFYTPKDYQEW